MSLHELPIKWREEARGTVGDGSIYLEHCADEFDKEFESSAQQIMEASNSAMNRKLMQLETEKKALRGALEAAIGQIDWYSDKYGAAGGYEVYRVILDSIKDTLESTK